MSSVRIRLPLPGPLVKRLRHRPFTAVTWVRFPYGSPNKKGHPFGCPFFVCRTGIERPLRKCASGTFLGRGRFPWLPDASRRDVDGSQLIASCAGFERPYGSQQHPVGDGSPVPKPDDYGFADTDVKIWHITAGTGNPSPTMYQRTKSSISLFYAWHFHFSCYNIFCWVSEHRNPADQYGGITQLVE